MSYVVFWHQQFVPSCNKFLMGSHLVALNGNPELKCLKESGSLTECDGKECQLTIL